MKEGFKWGKRDELAKENARRRETREEEARLAVVKTRLVEIKAMEFIPGDVKDEQASLTEEQRALEQTIRDAKR